MGAEVIDRYLAMASAMTSPGGSACFLVFDEESPAFQPSASLHYAIRDKHIATIQGHFRESIVTDRTGFAGLYQGHIQATGLKALRACHTDDELTCDLEYGDECNPGFPVAVLPADHTHPFSLIVVSFYSVLLRLSRPRGAEDIASFIRHCANQGEWFCGIL